MNPSTAPVKQVSTPDLALFPNEKKRIDEAYQKASQNKPVLDALLQRVASRSGARPITNFKNPRTAVEKVDEKNDESPKRNYSIEDINDLARGRLVYSSMDALRRGVDSFKQLAKKADVTISKQQDFFKKPENGYEGYHVDVTFPNGQHSEVQFHTNQSYAAAMATHPIHEQYGDKIPDNVKRGVEKVNGQIMKLPDQTAAKLAQAKEQETAPANAKAQDLAQRVIQGGLLKNQQPDTVVNKAIGVMKKGGSPTKSGHTELPKISSNAELTSTERGGIT